jgi:hypothetical protein
MQHEGMGHEKITFVQVINAYVNLGVHACTWQACSRTTHSKWLWV